MSKPDLRGEAHIPYKCWSCGWDNTIPVPWDFTPVKYKEIPGRTFPYQCYRCHKKVVVEVTEIVRFSPKVRIIIETQAWFQRLERTTP